MTSRGQNASDFQVGDIARKLEKTYGWETRRNLAHSRSGRESLQCINNSARVCLDVVTKWLNMPLENMIDVEGRVTRFDPGGK